MSAFEELGICPEIIQAVEEVNNKSKNLKVEKNRKLKANSIKVAFFSCFFIIFLFFHYCIFFEDDWLLPTPVQADAIPLILGKFKIYTNEEMTMNLMQKIM